MRPNPMSQELGFSADDRVVIIHADDVGMCQASVDAFIDLIDFGLVSCGSAMVPCAWFLEIARLFRANPEMDLGLHLTHTSEYETYRWRPLSTTDPQSGLLDEEGFFHRRPQDLIQQAKVEAVALEIEAQIKLALQAGVKPTHLDSHHGIVTNPKFIQSYIDAAQTYRILPYLGRINPSELLPSPETDEQKEMFKMLSQRAESVAQFEQQGWPIVDNFGWLPLDTPDDRLTRAKQIFADLKPGITHFVIHPLKDTSETRTITPSWACRVGDYEVFTNESMRSHIKNLGIQTIGYRQLADLLPV